MSDLVGNPEDSFSRHEVQYRRGLPPEDLDIKSSNADSDQGLQSSPVPVCLKTSDHTVHVYTRHFIPIAPRKLSQNDRKVLTRT